jgi:hypothetical protein
MDVIDDVIAILALLSIAVLLAVLLSGGPAEARGKWRRMKRRRRERSLDRVKAPR